MTYKFILAEKPSVAKSIASVLGASKREDGFYIGNGYIVSWCIGHLTEFSDPEIYDEKYAKWRHEDLPIIPSPWQYSVSCDKQKHLDLIRGLMHREDVGEVINACDAGREGELIFRAVYNLNGCTKPMKRLWISSMEDSAIVEGFANLRDGSEFDALFESALCRSKADWLVGINATRLFSVLYHRTLNVGRVVSPTLALLVEREAEISAFQPTEFYTVCLDMGGFVALSERICDKSVAERLVDACHGKSVTVKSVTHVERSERPPTLYDLTTLQRDANRLLGYTAQQTLDYLQSLYEQKLITYPRTDSRYLTDDMANSISAIILCAAGICSLDVPTTTNTSQLCDSRKVSDHHAIIPTMAGGEIDLHGLAKGERELLHLIATQVLMAVSEPHRYAETTVTVECGSTSFVAKGRTILDLGWRVYVGHDNETVLPEVAELSSLTVHNAECKVGTTTPPKHFTEDTLLSAMECAGAKEMLDDAERKGIGTPATRASIIEKLISCGFVERRTAKKTVSLIPLPIGTSLITVLPEQLQSPLLTAEWEHKLKQIERGELDSETFLGEITDMVSELVRDCKAVSGAEVLFPSGRPTVGKCPRCGGDVTESKMGYFCERNDCRFGLWRDNKFLVGKKINLTTKMAAALLKEGRTYASGIYSEKTGKSYDAYVMLEDDGERSTYKLDFTK